MENVSDEVWFKITALEQAVRLMCSVREGMKDPMSLGAFRGMTLETATQFEGFLKGDKQ